MSGTVHDPCTPDKAVPSGRTADDRWPDDRAVPCYWPYHKPVYDLGVDGWWPDQGDGLDAPSRLARIRMYWEGPQLWRPERAAVRAAPQRRSRHAALRRVSLVGRRVLDVGDAEDARAGRGQHRPVRHSVLGDRHRRVRADAGVHRRAARPLVPVRRVLSARSARTAARGTCACRGAGTRASSGPRKCATTPAAPANPDVERAAQRAGRADREEVPRAALPHAAVHLHRRARVLRHGAADDARALAAPSRRSAGGRARRSVPLGPRHARVAGRREGRDVAAAVSAARHVVRLLDGGTRSTAAARSIAPSISTTMPLHVRAGAILPLGPVRQYVDEPVDGPLSLVVYPGRRRRVRVVRGRREDVRLSARRVDADRDGWSDAARRLTLRLAPGSQMLPPARRNIEVRVAGEKNTRRVVFEGRPVELRL